METVYIASGEVPAGVHKVTDNFGDVWERDRDGVWWSDSWVNVERAMVMIHGPVTCNKNGKEYVVFYIPEKGEVEMNDTVMDLLMRSHRTIMRSYDQSIEHRKRKIAEGGDKDMYMAQIAALKAEKAAQEAKMDALLELEG